MNKFYNILGAAAMFAGASVASYALDTEPVNGTIKIGDTEYTTTLLEKRDVGPGTVWRRVRVNGYPLNVNLVTMDMTNRWARVETFQGQETLGKTESIVTAAGRLSTTGHKAVAGANGNFWCVATQEPWSDLLIGTTYGGNMRNSKIITETNNAADQWCGTPLQTCVIGADADRLWIEPLVWRGYVASSKTGYLDFQQVNKVVRDGEIGLYNSYYPVGKQFQPVDQYAGGDGKQHFQVVDGVATEVYLNLADGDDWASGKEFAAVVTDVRTNAGRGTLGNADMCLVARGDGNAAMATLVPGDTLRLYSGWTSFQTWETPQLENVMQGLALILKDGETDPETNQNNSYNNQVYPKTIYGCDKDNTMLYIMTIDKSTDPVWGASAGCPSWVACDILKAYGCWRAAAVDAGGSTQMFVTDRVVNKTTESAPRAVANGWMVFDTAPEDSKISRLEFDAVQLVAPVYSRPTPKVLGYNQYGTLVDDDVQGLTFTCSDGIGSCPDGAFVAGGQAGRGTLTAHLGDVSVTKDIEIVNADVAIRLKNIVIDHVRRYPVEVSAMVGDESFAYHPSTLTWTVSDGTVADIDAQGTLTGLANGTVTITGAIGDFVDRAEVSVQIPSAPQLPFDATDAWTTSTTNVKVSGVTAADGAVGVDFNISSTRAPKLTLTQSIGIYGLPDAFKFVINPGQTKVSSLILSVQTPAMSRATTLTVPVQFTAGEDNEVEVRMSDIFDTADLANYPVTFKSLAFNLGGSTGAYHLDVRSLEAVYDNYQSGVGNILTDGDAEGPAAYYTLQGVRVGGADLAPGIYIERRGNSARRILVR